MATLQNSINAVQWNITGNSGLNTSIPTNYFGTNDANYVFCLCDTNYVWYADYTSAGALNVLSEFICQENTNFMDGVTVTSGNSQLMATNFTGTGINVNFVAGSGNEVNVASGWEFIFASGADFFGNTGSTLSWQGAATFMTGTLTLAGTTNVTGTYTSSGSNIYTMKNSDIAIGTSVTTVIGIGTASTTAITMNGNSLIANFNGATGCTINASGTNGLTLSTTSTAPLTIETNSGNMLIQMSSASAGTFSLYGRNTFIDNNGAGQTATLWTTQSGTVILGNSSNTLALEAGTLNIFSPAVDFTSSVLTFIIAASTSITENAPTINIANVSTSTALNVGTTSCVMTFVSGNYSHQATGTATLDCTTTFNLAHVNATTLNIGSVTCTTNINGNFLNIPALFSATTPNPVYWNSSTGALSQGSAAGNTVDQTSNTGAATNTAYFANSSSLITIQLPATSVEGDFFEVNGKGSGGWLISQAASQQIFFGTASTTAGVSGSLASTAQYDCVRLKALTAGATSTWVVVASVGNLTVT